MGAKRYTKSEVHAFSEGIKANEVGYRLKTVILTLELTTIMIRLEKAR